MADDTIILDWEEHLNRLREKGRQERKRLAMEIDDTEIGPALIDLDQWKVKERFQGKAEPIEWLIKDVLPRKTVGLIASMGGIGKSMLCLDLCIRVAAGRSNIGGTNVLGGELVGTGSKAVFITAEDSQNAVHRRLNSIVHLSEISKIEENLILLPMSDAGGTRPFLINRSGEYQMTEWWEDLCIEIERIECELLVIDPLQSFIQADINDPAAAQCYWSAVSQLSAQCGTTVLTTHHMRKDNAKIDGVFSARAGIRGTSALVDGCRWSYCLFPVQNHDLKRIGKALGEDFGPLDLVYGAVVKSNEFGMSGLSTYVRDKNSGLLLDKTDEINRIIESSSTLTQEQVNELFAVAKQKYLDDEPFSGHHNGGNNYIGQYMVNHFNMDLNAAKKYLQKWFDGRNIKTVNHPSKHHQKCIRTYEIPHV